MAFVQYSKFNGKVDFSNNVLVLPTVSVGNVGQLAIDLLVSTLNFTKVGYIDSPFVLPLVGNDTFTPSGTGVITTALEVFQNTTLNCTLIQQRAPFVTQGKAQYAKQIATWAKQAGFKQIVILCSADASRRSDTQIAGPQFRYTSQGQDQLQIASLNWPTLEEHSVETVFRQGGLLKNLWNECESLSIPITALVLFCSEGNNIPESLGMSTLFLQLLRAPEVQWKFPPSWSNMEEGALRVSDIY